MTPRKILYGGPLSRPKFHVEFTFETPEGKQIGRVIHSGDLDYARGDWEDVDGFPEVLRQSLVDEMVEIVCREHILDGEEDERLHA